MPRSLDCRRRISGLLFLVCVLTLSIDARAESRGKVCQTSLSQCPDIGCATSGSPDALVNKLKHTLPAAGSKLTKLTLEDFFALQDRVAEKLGDDAEKADLDEAARQKLHALKLDPQREISEGDLVEVAGFVVGLPTRPKASGPESVNCRLSGPKNNDFHIPIAVDADSTEFEGIVVEMIPQGRNSGWTVKKLKRIAKEGRPVVIRGQLFYDNKHRVNDDPDEVLGGEPKRASLWEVHPVTEFFVCMAANKKCNIKNVTTKQWVRLEKLED